jgi:hypothetical protein
MRYWLAPGVFFAMHRPNEGDHRVNYLPPFEGIKALVSFAAVKGELTVSASYTQFAALIRILLQGIGVDEAWYLNQYPDVADAIEKGIVASAKAHFLNDGYFEGRLPFLIKVDEAWYLDQNPGVAEYIKRGELESAQQHFNDNGYREGRRPFPG